MGGFSKSDYVMNQLKEAFPMCSIMRPAQPILSVVKGAAQFAKQPSTIRSYISPKTIGVKVVDHWDRARDPEDAKFAWDPEQRRYVTNRRFAALIEIGQCVSYIQPPKVRYFQPVDETHREIKVELYKTTLRVAELSVIPRRLADSKEIVLAGTVKFPVVADYWSSDKHKQGIKVGFRTNGRELWLLVDIPGEESTRTVNFDWN